MRIEKYKYPKSSFLSIEKDMGIIVDRILKNERLKKLLYYTTADALSRPNLTADETYALFGDRIRIVPKIDFDTNLRTYLVIHFHSFVPNLTNPEFRNNTIEFDIVCHLDQWHLADFQARPHKIAAELDAMFNDFHLTGIGDLQFAGATYIPLTEDFGGFCLQYTTVHGEEDKKNTPNPNDNQDLIDNFNAVFNDE